MTKLDPDFLRLLRLHGFALTFYRDVARGNRAEVRLAVRFEDDMRDANAGRTDVDP
jgi:hypothetical protein